MPEKCFIKIKLTPEIVISSVESSSGTLFNDAEGQKLIDVLHPDYLNLPINISKMTGDSPIEGYALFGRFEGFFYYLRYKIEKNADDCLMSLYEVGGLGPEDAQVKDSSLSAIADKILGTFYRSDKYGNFIYFTENSVKLLGYSPEELLGGSLRSKFFLSEKNYDALKEKIVHQGWLSGAEVSLRHKDGRIIWLKVDNTAFYDEDGNYTGAGGYVQDITEYKNKEEELAHTRRLLELKQAELDALKTDMKFQVQDEVSKGRKKQEDILYHARLAEMGEMVSSIAHQWRQPLSALSFIIEDIRDAYHFGELDIPYLDDAISECMSYISFMSETMDDFRNFFRPEPEREYFNLIEKTLDVVKMQYGRFEVGAVNVVVQCDMDGKLSNIITMEYGHGVKFHTADVEMDAGIVVYGYPNLFKQVVINLLNNSVDAIMESREKGQKGMTEAGHIEILLGIKDGKAFISIEDNGTGIPEEIVDNIFDSEFTTKPKSKGTGIGLHMAKAIAENSLSGTITCENGDKGARFIVKMPHISIKTGI